MGNLKGSLQSISLTDVVQLLHVNKKTGELRVSNGKEKGILFVVDGEVLHAELGTLKGEGAAFETLEWERGEFEFFPVKVRPGGSIRRSVPDLLMEAARTSDSRRRFRSIFPSLEAVPWCTIEEPALTFGLKVFPEDRKAIPFFDGYRDFRQVMEHAELSEVTVLQAAQVLKEAGRLQVLLPAVSLRVLPLKTGFFKKGDHVEVAKAHEDRWKAMGPYSRGRLANLRIQWASGAAVEPVQFVAGLEEGSIAIPREFMQAWGLAETDSVAARPAP
ncbi:MAG: DUF4388 domain-containing protein [Acidobacteria bacterium]|nr:DUF4388 domain-containing protein [Acidobacteriota bacterium]